MESSFLSIAIEALELLSDPELAHILNSNDINFSQMRREKTIVYIVVPEDEARDYSFLVNLVYTQAFKEWRQEYKAIQRRNITHTLKRSGREKNLSVYCIMDEFANL